MHDAFISYSAQDKTTADAVCATLESRGIRCWIAPRDVLPGEDYAESLIKAVHDSKLLILVFSSRANQSPQVLRELERAVSRGLPIIPIRIENTPPSAAMEYYISSRHWLDALTPPLEQHLIQLADTVKLFLSRTSPEEAPRVLQFVPHTTPAANARAPRSKFLNWVWPIITDIQTARAASRQGIFAALVVASVTTILALIALAGAPVMGIDGTALLDAVIFFLVAWRIHRFSKVAPIVGLALFVAGRLYMWSVAGPSNPILPIILTLAFINSIRGTYAYHEFVQQREQTPGPAGEAGERHAA